MSEPRASECARCKGATRDDLPLFLAVGKRVYAFCSSRCIERFAKHSIIDRPLCPDCLVRQQDVAGRCKPCYTKAWRAAQPEDSRYRRYVSRRVREKRLERASA